VLIVNRSYREAAEFTLRIEPGAAMPERLDVATARWVRDEVARLRIAPGAGVLLRWPR
jgi:hypothetical protein